MFGIAPPVASAAPSQRPDEVKVWYDGWAALMLFFTLQTQWRVGFAGRTGLDYTAVLAVVGLHTPRRAKQLEVLAELAALEAGVLRADAERSV